MATNQAGPVALLSGEADVIVSDWPWALRQRAMGEHTKFAPYSSALGAVMVAPDSPMKTLADLKGKEFEPVPNGPIPPAAHEEAPHLSLPRSTSAPPSTS